MGHLAFGNLILAWNIFFPIRQSLFAVPAVVVDTRIPTGGIYRWTGDFQTLASIANAGVYRKFGNVFPNPFSDYTTIEFEVTSPAPIRYTLANLSGKIVERGKIERGLMGKDHVMIRPKVSAGTYFLTLRQGNRTETIKLVKQ
ncbi:MAG: T9SS type A sorting domain-containing protein [Saprospiraceae bacterium]|nr:T9SS type A sorting domain-containing protein [Saprospiraceae bacterium]